jgi:hypothetical protein
LRALEASAITGQRNGLRRGSFWINHSLSFRDRDQLLIPSVQWKSDRDRYLSSLGLAGTADSSLERLTEHLKAGWLVQRSTRGTQGAFGVDARRLTRR